MIAFQVMCACFTLLNQHHFLVKEQNNCIFLVKKSKIIAFFILKEQNNCIFLVKKSKIIAFLVKIKTIKEEKGVN